MYTLHFNPSDFFPFAHPIPPKNMYVQKSFLFYLFFLSLCFMFSSAENTCFDSVCRPDGPLIRFPFRIQNRQPQSCGFPGFDLACDANNQTVLELPSSGNFTIRSIDYAMQELRITDPKGCLPRRLLSFNLSGSRFSSLYHQDFTFFKCTGDFRTYPLTPIFCLSGSNYTVFTASSPRAVQLLTSLRTCSLVKSVAVPVEWPLYESSFDVFSNLRLTWSAPQCGECESRGDRCGFKNNSTMGTNCKPASQHGSRSSMAYGITLAIGVPSILCVIGLLCFFGGWIKSPDNQNTNNSELPTTISLCPMTSLNGQTIEAYPETLLGESCRLPNPNDDTCSICLSEYRPKETLRCISECRHCFHAECIDEWLRLNATCPICRKQPQPPV